LKLAIYGVADIGEIIASFEVDGKYIMPNII
jgi:hypothetical protein